MHVTYLSLFEDYRKNLLEGIKSPPNNIDDHVNTPSLAPMQFILLEIAFG